MSIKLDYNYEKALFDAKPILLEQHIVRPPLGALGDITTIPEQTIPPINTNIQFNILPEFKISEHPGLAAIDHTKLPENFNWRENGGKKKYLLSIPGDQMLCGSCWAISAAGIVADNHVISGTVNWKPNLSTTWCLACYPQAQCKGGNPAKLYEDISEHGVATNNCIDYSWCSENPACNGKATKHFENGEINLSAIIPNCGCYDSQTDHYLYFIDKPKAVSLDKGDLDEDNFTNTIKKHIYTNGPVQGGFLVFDNFIHGGFTKVNGGVYLENGTYGKGEVHFDPDQLNVNKYYKGSHAIAIIGWGIEKGVVVDNEGNKKDVPYWYCRNSWTEKWGDGGYFKMAMYPFNKLVQFDKVVVISTPQGPIQSGGMVIMTASKPPDKKSLPQIQKYFLQLARSQPNSYYSQEIHDSGAKKASFMIKNILKYILIVIGIIIIMIISFFLYKYLHSRKSLPSYKQNVKKSISKSVHKMIKGRAGSY